MYEGQFKNGKPQGQGRLDFVNGDQMEGTFDNFILHGPGTRFFRKNSTIFKGTFVKGSMFGKGMTTKYVDSSLRRIDFIIEGDFVGNLPHGHCRIEFYSKSIVDDDYMGEVELA